MAKADQADRDGDASLHAIYADEAPRLARYFRRRGRDQEDAADLVQQAFLRFMRAAGRDMGNPVGYLHRIARNLLVDTLRAATRHGAVFDPASDEEGVVRPDQGEQLEADQLMDAYQRAVQALPPRTRDVFLRHRRDGQSYRAIAAELGIGVRTVEWHIAEALVRIRRVLDEA